MGPAKRCLGCQRKMSGLGLFVWACAWHRWHGGIEGGENKKHVSGGRETLAN